jgi:hypothetical protein
MYSNGASKRSNIQGSRTSCVDSQNWQPWQSIFITSYLLPEPVIRPRHIAIRCSLFLSVAHATRLPSFHYLGSRTTHEVPEACQIRHQHLRNRRWASRFAPEGLLSQHCDSEHMPHGKRDQCERDLGLQKLIRSVSL